MSIRERQLRALKQTRDMLIKEWNGCDNHEWNVTTCPLCIEFRNKECKGCPFNKFKRMGKYDVGCYNFQLSYGYEDVTKFSPIDETLSIILSMIDCWEGK